MIGKLDQIIARSLRKLAEDTHVRNWCAWLRDYCKWQPPVIAYAVEINGRCSPTTLDCTRFLGLTENEDWLRLDLRHTAVTTMAEKGLPEQTIMAQVGHVSSPQMLKTYSHIRRQALNLAAAALEPSFLRTSTTTTDAELIN